MPPRPSGESDLNKPVDEACVSRGHEPLDVGVLWIGLIVLTFVLLFAGVLWGTWAVFHGMSRDATTPPPSTEHDDVRPAATRLEPSPGHQEQDWQHLAAAAGEADQAIFKSGAAGLGDVRAMSKRAGGRWRRGCPLLSRRPPTSRPTTGRADDGAGDALR